MTLPKQRLGHPETGPMVSTIGLGCMTMSDFYDSDRDEARSIRTIHRALEMGMNFLDSSNIYGPYTNEILVGKAIADRRDQAFLCTKFGIMRDDEGNFLGVNGKPDYVKECCDDSLKRLGIDTIDLYYQHRVDPETPIEDTVGAMKQLVDAGKVRYLGLSEAAVTTIRKAHAVHPISALQSEYSLWTREVEEEHIPTCRELGITFVAYSPLGRGFLTGSFSGPDDLEETDWRRPMPRFAPENLEQNRNLVEHIKSLAEKKGVTPAQLAIAWTKANHAHVLPIPGTKRIEYLEQNADAIHVTFTADELTEIDRVFPVDAAAGARYPEGGMKAVNR